MKSQYKTAAVVAVALVLVGAVIFVTTSDEVEADVKIGLVAWDCAIASSNVMKLVLEEEGYSVELVETEAGPMYTGLSQGNTDVTLTAWLPFTHATYWTTYGDDLEELGRHIEGEAKIGLVVPNYTAEALGLTTIGDLKGQEGEFGGEIIGIDAGAGIMTATENAIDNYSLAMTLVESSTAGMLSALDAALDAGEHIAVTLWDPHWAFAAYNTDDYHLVYLEDPTEQYGQAEDIVTLAHKDFATNNPELAAILTNFNWTVADMNQVMDLQQEHGEVTGAQMWINENRDKVDGWLGK